MKQAILLIVSILSFSVLLSAQTFTVSSTSSKGGFSLPDNYKQHVYQTINIDGTDITLYRINEGSVFAANISKTGNPYRYSFGKPISQTVEVDGVILPVFKSDSGKYWTVGVNSLDYAKRIKLEVTQ